MSRFVRGCCYGYGGEPAPPGGWGAPHTPTLAQKEYQESLRAPQPSATEKRIAELRKELAALEAAAKGEKS
jgi:hypothetical protein